MKLLNRSVVYCLPMLPCGDLRCIDVVGDVDCLTLARALTPVRPDADSYPSAFAPDPNLPTWEDIAPSLMYVPLGTIIVTLVLWTLLRWTYHHLNMRSWLVALNHIGCCDHLYPRIPFFPCGGELGPDRCLVVDTWALRVKHVPQVPASCDQVDGGRRRDLHGLRLRRPRLPPGVRLVAAAQPRADHRLADSALHATMRHGSSCSAPENRHAPYPGPPQPTQVHRGLPQPTRVHPSPNPPVHPSPPQSTPVHSSPPQTLTLSLTFGHPIPPSHSIPQVWQRQWKGCLHDLSWMPI